MPSQLIRALLSWLNDRGYETKYLSKTQYLSKSPTIQVNLPGGVLREGAYTWTIWINLDAGLMQIEERRLIRGGPGVRCRSCGTFEMADPEMYTRLGNLLSCVNGIKSF